MLLALVQMESSKTGSDRRPKGRYLRSSSLKDEDRSRRSEPTSATTSKHVGGRRLLSDNHDYSNEVRQSEAPRVPISRLKKQPKGKNKPGEMKVELSNKYANRPLPQPNVSGYERLVRQAGDTSWCANCRKTKSGKFSLSCGHMLCSKCATKITRKNRSSASDVIPCPECCVSTSGTVDDSVPSCSGSDSDESYEELDPETMIENDVPGTPETNADLGDLTPQWPDTTILKAEYLHEVLTGPRKPLARAFLQSLPGSEQQRVLTELVQGQTALYVALRTGALLLMAYMMEEGGADPNQMSYVPNENGELKRSTCLIQAAFDGNMDAVELLVINGADVNLADEEGWTPLTSATCSGNADIVKFLVHNGANVHDISPSGLSCLLLSIEHPDLIKFLLSYGSDIMESDKEGRTALHLAARCGCLDSINELLRRGADVDIQDEDGNSPLHEAILSGMLPSVNLLVEHGADIYLRNHNKEDAILLASLENESAILHYLISAHKVKKHIFYKGAT